MPRNKSVEAAGVGACKENDPARQSTQALTASGTEICAPGQHQSEQLATPARLPQASHRG